MLRGKLENVVAAERLDKLCEETAVKQVTSKLGRTTTRVAYEQKLRITDGDDQLIVRRLTITRDKPTSKGEKEIHLLNNLRQKVEGKKLVPRLDAVTTPWLKSATSNLTPRVARLLIKECGPNPCRQLLPCLLLLTVTLLGGAGCRPDTTSEQQASIPEDGSLATETIGDGDVSTEPAPAGTLSGTVTFDGDPLPQVTMIPIQTDPEYCDRHGKDGLYPKEDCLIDADSRGIRNVIVYLMGDALRNWPDVQHEDIVVDNRECRFEPHVNVSVVGSTVEVKNSDEIYHTTHLYGPPGFVEFNPGMRSKGDAEKTVLTRPGIYLIKCDRHGWMSAFLRVDTHPFHAVTDDTGKFEITGIPSGTYQVGMFHERFRTDAKDPEAMEVTVQAGQTTSVNLTLSQ